MLHVQLSAPDHCIVCLNFRLPALRNTSSTRVNECPVNWDRVPQDRVPFVSIPSAGARKCVGSCAGDSEQPHCISNSHLGSPSWHLRLGLLDSIASHFDGASTLALCAGSLQSQL